MLMSFFISDGAFDDSEFLREIKFAKHYKFPVLKIVQMNWRALDARQKFPRAEMVILLFVFIAFQRIGFGAKPKDKK